MSLYGLICNLFTKKCILNSPRNISTFVPLNREHRKNKRHNIVLREDTVPQEKSFKVEPAWIKQCEFPDESTNDRLFNGVRFADLPIVHIRVSKNNTKFHLTDAEGQSKYVRSCGMEGFKNAKKGTNIAAQATAVAFSTRIKSKGYHQVRVAIRGLGPGRMASVKGLEMGLLNIVSVTDTTPTVLTGGNRPRKQRRV